MIQALARGACPICMLMRAFQNSMSESPHSYPATRLCNFHAWSLAGSSPAIEAVPIFRAMMIQASEARPRAKPNEMHSCDWCVALREHEHERLAEFRREMKRDTFASWVRQFGTVCLYHADRLVEILPKPEAKVIQKIVENSRAELEGQLTEFDAKLHRGERGGGGILGHITEFLVSQRGLTR
jgi:hypothetical protein